MWYYDSFSRQKWIQSGGSARIKILIILVIMILIVIFGLILGIAHCQSIDFPKEKYCDINKNHTVCLHQVSIYYLKICHFKLFTQFLHIIKSQNVFDLIYEFINGYYSYNTSSNKPHVYPDRDS